MAKCIAGPTTLKSGRAMAILALPIAHSMPGSTVLNLFHRAVIFYFLLFRSFYLIKLLIFIRK